MEIEEKRVTYESHVWTMGFFVLNLDCMFKARCMANNKDMYISHG